MEKLASLKALTSWRQQSCKCGIPAQAFLRLPFQMDSVKHYDLLMFIIHFTQCSLSLSSQGDQRLIYSNCWFLGGGDALDNRFEQFREMSYHSQQMSIFKNKDRQEWNDGRMMTSWQRRFWGTVSWPRCTGLCNCRQLQLGHPQPRSQGLFSGLRAGREKAPLTVVFLVSCQPRFSCSVVKIHIYIH